MEVYVRQSDSESYYIVIDTKREYIQHVDNDIDVANLLGMYILEYQNFMVKEYNGKICGLAGIFFDNKDNAWRACKWIESGLIISKLRGDT